MHRDEDPRPSDRPTVPARPPQPALTAEYVRACLDYDPATGICRWRHREDKPARTNGRWAGTVAGKPNYCGYIVISINTRHYMAHRLIWLMVTGEWPQSRIDHENTKRADNRWTNLRLATNSQNLCNRGRTKSNTSGYKGVTWNADLKKWQSQIMVDYKNTILGYFSNAEDAYSAYCAAAMKLHGEFVNLGAPNVES